MSTIDLNELLPALKDLHSLWRYRVKQLNGGDAMCPGTVLATFLTTVEDIGNFMKAIGYDTQEQSDEKVVGYEFWGNIHGRPPEKIPGGPFYLREKAQEPEAVNTNCNMPDLLQAIVDNKGGDDWDVQRMLENPAVQAAITQARREGIIEGFAAGSAGHWSDDIPSEFIDTYNSVDDYLKEKERDGK